MKELRFLQPNQIDAETRNDPQKLQAYFDWKYEKFEEEYKIYREEKSKLLDEFLDSLPSEKKDYYIKRKGEYFDKFEEILDRYESVLAKAKENEDMTILKKAIDEEHIELVKLKEEYKDIEFMLK